MSELFGNHGGEKKVEYIELIYDLIFVYIIGRNNSLLHTIENGFIGAETYFTYIISTLVILHVWYFTVLFINRYGSNGFAEYLCIFINMYLLYYMADGTRVHWQEFYVRYNVAWGLILINLGVQYLIKLKKSGRLMPWQDKNLKYNMYMLFTEAVIVFASIPLYMVTKIPFAPLAMVFGMIASIAKRDVNKLMSVDFAHLTERVMLYVVFTFGEMIIGIAGYFEGGFSFNSIYFSLMAFLIVAGLFLCYGYFYDNVIDRESETAGVGYMFIHIFLITALNNITVALEFMREPEVNDVPKNVFMVASMVVYFTFLFLTERYAKPHLRISKRYFAFLGLISLAFICAMALSYKYAYISIAATVIYIYAVFVSHYLYCKKRNKEIAE